MVPLAGLWCPRPQGGGEGVMTNVTPSLDPPLGGDKATDDRYGFYFGKLKG